MKTNTFAKYVRASFEELTKVTWPTKNRAIRLTAIVLGICLAFGFFLAAVDFVLGEGYGYIIQSAV